MTKAECHGCAYCQKPKGKKRYWCMVPRSNTPLKDIIRCEWWHHYGSDRKARKHEENIHNIKIKNKMTIYQKQINHAAERLLASPGLVRKGMYLPKIYIVEGKCYWFLNVARRAAFGTKHRIYVLTIEDAWKIVRRKSEFDRHHIIKEFDQTGDTYDGKLFNQAGSVFANLVPNKIITIKL